jgi:HK97 family phage major capsid protein
MPRLNIDHDSLLSQANSLLAKPNFSKEDSSKVTALLELADRTGPEALRLKRAKVAQSELEVGVRSADNAGSAQVEADFQTFLRSGKNAIPIERRAQAFSTDNLGGYLVPASFREELEVALRAYDGLFEAAGRWESQTGSAIAVPILDDTTSTATIIAENALIPLQDIASFDALSFGKTPKWDAGIILASIELVTDSYFPLASVLARAFGVRFARGIGATLVSTLIAGADVGATTTSPTSVAASELLDLAASLDSAYWNAASWCMAKSTLISLLKLGMLSDASGQAVTMWTTGQLRLFDKPIFVCPSMDSIAATKKPISFGDHSKLLRREVANSLRVQTLVERYATNLQVGYTAMWRVDSGFLKPAAAGSPAVSQSPVQILQCHA